MSEPSLNPQQLVEACKNIGYDLSCGRCAGVFFTGSALGESHDQKCASGYTSELLSAAVAWYTATVTPESAARVVLYARERALRLAIRNAYRAVHGRDL